MSTQMEGGFRLHHFQSDVEAGKTKNISASALDGNFQLVKPRTINGGLKHYTVNQETNGWDLKIFPAWPSVPSMLCFGHKRSSAQSGNPGLSWIPYPPPPNGAQPSWREVERCDGKKMYVWGTEWSD